MKKLLAILLALTLALTLVPTLAFAQNEDGAEPGIVEESKETPTEAPEGETKEEPTEEPMEEPQENPEGETKEEGKEETKEESEDKLEDTGDVQAAPLLTAENTDADTPVALDVNTHVIDNVLQPGNYYLIGNITRTIKELRIKNNVTIDLRGQTVDVKVTSVTIYPSGCLTLKDTTGNGRITFNGKDDSVALAGCDVYGKFIMAEGARIDGVKVSTLIDVWGNGEFIMNNGSSIKNCTIGLEVVKMFGGTFIMNGGIIKNNTKRDGSLATAVNGNGRFYQYGGAIDGTVQGAAIKWDATENAYLIYTAEGLKAFRDIVNGLSGHTANPSVNGKLMNDIDLGDDPWTPIGTEANPYTGSFNGNGHTIKGLYVKDEVSAGLFGYIQDSTDLGFYQIQNVAVTGYVEGTEYAGGIAGYANGSSIEGCVNLCSVSVSGNDQVFVGGIVGLAAGGSIADCTNIGRISGEGYDIYAGGIAGHTIAASKCYWLTGTADRAVGQSSGESGTFAKAKAQFADGTVLALLKGNDTNSPWAKTGYVAAAGMALPLLSWQTADSHDHNTGGLFGGCTCGITECDGTKEHPYLIYNAADLKAFRDLVNGNNGQTKNPSACAELKADIVLNDGTFDENGNWSEGDAPEVWAPFDPYYGTFNGNGHTIKGLYVKDKDKAGLFGELHGTIKNLAVTGYVQGGMFVGGIAATANGGKIENCVNLCRVVANGNDGTLRAYAGGIVGQDTGGAILNCANLGAISCNVGAWILIDYAAGIAGWVDNTTITRCYNVGGISENGIGEHGSRGIAGVVYSVNVSHCYWLAGSVQGVDDTADDAKTKVEFANELLALLQNGDENSPWTKTGYLAAAKMTLPLLKWQTADEHTHDGAQWLSDATSHWKECTCGVIYDKAAHSGGTATSTAKAKCEVCGQPYGQLASGGIRRQPTGGSGAANTSDTTKTVKSGNTGDAGIALYAGMALLSLTGGAWLRRKKH